MTTYERPKSVSPSKLRPGDKYVKHFADLVQPQHRLQKNEMLQLWKTVLEMDKRIKDPKDDLLEIARKITAWKR